MCSTITSYTLPNGTNNLCAIVVNEQNLRLTVTNHLTFSVSLHMYELLARPSSVLAVTCTGVKKKNTRTLIDIFA